jgi:hypothetical protein
MCHAMTGDMERRDFGRLGVRIVCTFYLYTLAAYTGGDTKCPLGGAAENNKWLSSCFRKAFDVLQWYVQCKPHRVYSNTRLSTQLTLHEPLL